MEETSKMKKTLYLPHELIIHILLRLPVKSLACFKCVCKSWLSLISDPSFANLHFELTAVTHDRRIMFISTIFHESRSIDFETSLNHFSTSLSLDFLRPHFRSDFIIEMKSSCRGFIFLNCSSKIFLWNPSTGVHKQIPLPPVVSCIDPDDIFNLYGFGYDHSTDDYLVVSMSCDSSTDVADISSTFNIFSLRANTWKQIEFTALLNYRHFPYLDDSFYEQRLGFLCNGALHWLAVHEDLNKDVIFAFHLMERQLLEMYFPNDFDHDFNQDPTDCDLWVFGEFLSLWAIEDRTVVNIWVMIEYGVHSSWTKTLVLSTVDIPTRYFHPICYTRSGEIIGTDGHTGLVKYDDKGQLLEHRSYSNDREGSQVVVYIESLLSLPSDNEQA
ncbi:F-box/kelch-repeat protein At3g06240-like [Vicia villosa]|uniref:F-box/kelch-repeat protein At3g06240-like n=1 Tax=Vicia villosa TaxID=3911 RepID=UPI00273BFCAD|nr:F-box/kelch-repeat protein At3g06240-like [Vicia villosa]